MVEGPWKIGERIGFGRWGGYRQITSEDCLRYGSDERKVFALSDPEHASMIAASPEMLDALRDAAGLLKHLGQSDRNGTLAKVRAAIAKADPVDPQQPGLRHCRNRRERVVQQ